MRTDDGYEDYEDYEKLLVLILQEFPDFKIIYKRNSKLMGFFNMMLRVLSFNQMKEFINSYNTTFAGKVYVSEKWDFKSNFEKIITLRHELVHLRQAKRYGGFLFSFLYALVFLPVGLSYFRMKFEKEAYEETLRSIRDVHGPDALDRVNKDKIVGVFTSSNYLWAWPFKGSIEKWLSETIEKVKNEKVS
jgi:hypothetical protein